ncbi:hypothetical protein QN277_004649 [Acacia crassicarpa]|uniref:LOB domain-containing protein n=1 Tax=Acacia crassicarpa TaxID=499986 RepID=A0AAE1MIL4_9FABA|nr:hypothetical protein QN277_004649 [Acacia crassicarpa]
MARPSPCASCKRRRRRCATDCIFAPYFPSDDPQKFAVVHKVFGTSNVRKMLQELPVHQRGYAVRSLVYEAKAWAIDRVYGCVGYIASLKNQLAEAQNQVSELQKQLDVAQAQELDLNHAANKRNFDLNQRPSREDGPSGLN